MTLEASQARACCTAVYSSEAVRWLLGDSMHPGGAELTGRLARALEVGPGRTVVDVASGFGTSALQLARDTGCDVIGIELVGKSVAYAEEAALREGLGGRVRFFQGDAEALPLEDESMDGAMCECALCTFPDKTAAAREIARVLGRGARLALSDVTAVPERLPDELRSLTAWAACVADARPLEEIVALVDDAGLEVEATERHDAALDMLLERVEARLRAARAFAGPLLAEPAGLGLELAAAARAALVEGTLGYASVVARRA